MLDWLTHDGQAFATANGYVPLLPQIQQLARTMLQQVLGSGEKPCSAKPWDSSVEVDRRFRVSERPQQYCLA
jgi:hypothetical protein